jgi:hypothetical protein
VIDFREVRVRSNPRLQLIPQDRLEPRALDEFRSLCEDPDFFGILLPAADSKLPAKSVSRDAALLFLALAEPACLPRLLTSLFGSDANERVRQLVLDGVLEVEQPGAFVSGAAALELLNEGRQTPGSSRVAQLSSAAIDYAEALPSLEVNEIAARLYLFNTAPSTPALQRRFATDEQLLQFLFETTAVARRMCADWRRQPVQDSWLVWSNARTAEPAPYKLYVSPTLEDLPPVFAAASDSFTRAGCKQFKLGRGAYGVLRPDKLVAFFVDLDQLLQAAELIQRSARGASAQGVPFSAPIDPGGLLSWGMDPPRFEQVLAGRQLQSWRQWLTERIAVYAIAARQSGTAAQAFVRERIAFDGVDPSNWNLNLTMWREPLVPTQEIA